MAVLEKEYGYGITGESQLDMTPFQKQVLLLEEKRQQEEAEKQQGQGQGPSGALNARRSGYQEQIHYDNEQSYETENQAEFVE